MDDPLTDKDDSKQVDYFAEQGPGHEASQFSMAAQKKEFLGGASGAQEARPQTSLMGELNRLYAVRGEKTQELNQLKSKGRPKFFGKGDYETRTSQLQREIQKLPVPISELKTYIENEILTIDNKLQSEIIDAVARRIPMPMMNAVRKHPENVTEENIDLQGTLRGVGGILDVVKQSYLPRYHRETTRPGGINLVREAEKIEEVSKKIQRDSLPKANEQTEQSKQTFLAKIKSLEGICNKETDMVARQVPLGVLEVAKEQAEGINSDNVNQRSAFIDTLTDGFVAKYYFPGFKYNPESRAYEKSKV